MHLLDTHFTSAHTKKEMSSVEMSHKAVSLLFSELSMRSRKLDTTLAMISFDSTVCNEVYPEFYSLIQKLINILTFKGVTREDAIIKLNELLDISINIEKIENEIEETPFDEIGQDGDFRILYDLKIRYMEVEHYLCESIINLICY